MLLAVIMVMETRGSWILFVALVVACNDSEEGSSSLSSTGAGDCSVGQEGCPCVDTLSCMPGLSCVLGVCRNFEGDSVGMPAGSTGPSTSSTSGTEGTSATIGESTSASTGASTSSSTGTTSGSDTGSSTSQGSESSSADTTNSETDGDASCIPYTTRCVSTTEIQECNAQGTWEPARACVNQACVGYECSGECFPGTTQCLSAAQFQRCSDQGLWGNPTDCIDQTCIGNICQGECAPEQKRCDGENAQSCDVAGKWTTHDQCNVPVQACELGECVGCQGWTRQLGSSEDDRVNSIAVDSSGGVYLGGYTQGTFFRQTSSGQTDAFVARYDQKGARDWLSQFGSEKHDSVWGIVVDSSGRVYLSGYTSGALHGNISKGGNDAFIAQIDQMGNLDSVTQFGSSDNDYAKSIAIAPSGRIYLAGQTSGTLHNNTSKGGSDVFVAQFNKKEKELWARQFGSSSDDDSWGMAVAPSGRVYVSGLTIGTLTDNMSMGGEDAFVAHYDQNGGQHWAKQFGSSANEHGVGIAVDSSDYVYLSGWTTGILGKDSSKGGQDAYVARFDKNRNLVWLKHFGTDKIEYGQGVAVDTLGRVYLSGLTYGAFPGYTSNGLSDAFVILIDRENGKQIWTKQIGTEGHDAAWSIVVASSGQIYIGGSTTGAIDGTTSNGGQDAFIARICPPSP